MNDQFKEFMLAEYNNIAKAHFKTAETISTFFKHYLAIVSIPISLIVLVVGLLEKSDIAKVTPNPQDSPAISVCYGLLPSIVLFLIGLVGLFVMVYVINLRHDALLYARTVNTIRSRFVNESKLALRDILLTKVLPTQAHLPNYHEPWYFAWVVLTFAVIDSFYCALGALSFNLCLPDLYNLKPIVQSRGVLCVVIFVFVVGVHYLVYQLLCEYRDRFYLQSVKFGVDIDGVLNRHREHFTHLLASETKHKLDPNDITVTPVHEDETKMIPKEDCNQVFHNAKYWTDMPVDPEAPPVLARLRNSFGFKVWIFTYRDWPQAADKKEVQRLERLWKQDAYTNAKKEGNLRALLYLAQVHVLRQRAITFFTKSWLAKNGISYDRLVIEKGNEYVRDTTATFRNRFHISRVDNVRYFVEDDLDKALKLSHICEVVFLINHPYNQCKSTDLPINVLRVGSWKQIYSELKRLT